MEKNHGIWKDRPAVQKAFDVDPQHAYNCVAKVLTPEQAEVLESLLCPPPSADEVIITLANLKEMMEKHGIDSRAVDEKIEEIEQGLDSKHNS